jgi:hypothetical protein
MPSFDDGPETAAQLIEMMSGYPAAWALCGGWAVDAWLGHKTRDHPDIDLAIFEDEQLAVLEHFRDWRLVGHDDAFGDHDTRWTGHHFEVPGHIIASRDGVELDFQLNERSADEWVLRRDPRITLSLTRCIVSSNWGVPIAGPEVTLYYKAEWNGEGGKFRPHDHADFEVALPRLDGAQRQWLHHAISSAWPDHPWLARLSK